MLMIKDLFTLLFPSASILEMITAEEIWQKKPRIKQVRMKKVLLSIYQLPLICDPMFANLDSQASA
jgi:hypothetical protein